MSEQLKPCPFCGNPPEITRIFNPSEDCPDCFNTYIECPQHKFIHDTETWNTRPVEDSLRDEINQLKNTLADNEAFCASVERRADELQARAEKAEAENLEARRFIKIFIDYSTNPQRCEICGRLVFELDDHLHLVRVHDHNDGCPVAEAEKWLAAHDAGKE